MKKVALLFSSGVESSCLTAFYLSEGFLVYPLYVRSGMPWERWERKHSLRLWTYFRGKFGRILPLRTLPARGISPQGNTIEIPLRNLLLISSAAVEAFRKGILRVGVGSLGIYPFPDTERSYFDSLEELVERALRIRFRIETPFLGMEKAQVIREFWGSVPFVRTFSCIRPVRGVHCGRCAKCLERKEGFVRAGVPDPTRYLS